MRIITSSLTAAVFLTAPLVLLGQGPLLAQGQDQCANAQPILGLGTFFFDNGLATHDGSPDFLCSAFGMVDIDHDVWFEWTAPTSGQFQLDTCGQTFVDTKIGIYDGSCAGSVLACNEDSCGSQSRVVWSAGIGDPYLIRLGTFPHYPGGTGHFTIREHAPALNPANGHYYLAVHQPTVTWTHAEVAARSLPYQGFVGHLATLTDRSENDFVFALGLVHLYWIGGYQDLDDPNYSEPGGAWKWITGEPWSYANWFAGEPNNSCDLGAQNYLELREGGTLAGTWIDGHPLQFSLGFIIEWDKGEATNYCFGDGSGGACPCVNEGGPGEGCANSSGSGAVATTAGSASASADDLLIGGAHLLHNQPALLFSGDNAVNGGAGHAFGDGLRCAGGSLKRLGVEVPDAAGDASFGPGLGTSGGWSAGDTKRFQIWYRDPSGSPCGFSFNLSHGVEIVFVP